MLFLRRRREQRRSFPRWRAGRRIFCFVLFLFSGTYLLKERAISFSSGFSGPWDNSVRRPASSLLPTTHFASSQESTVRGRHSSPRTSGQSRSGPREFGEDGSERTALTPFLCTTIGPSIVLLEPLAQRLEAWLTLPSLPRLLTRTIRLGYAIQFARRPPKFNGVLETSVAVRNAPVLREEIAVLLAKDAIEPVPPAEMRQGFYSPYFIVPKKGGGLRPILDLRVLNQALHKLPVQDADTQAHDQMHSTPGLVCSDQPEGRLLSRFDPPATQIVSTVCVRRSGMAVQGPPLRVSPCLPVCSRRL